MHKPESVVYGRIFKILQIIEMSLTRIYLFNYLLAKSFALKYLLLSKNNNSIN